MDLVEIILLGLGLVKIISAGLGIINLWKRDLSANLEGLILVAIRIE